MEFHLRNIRQTDFDALSSRYSAVRQKYLVDNFIQEFVDGIKTLPAYRRQYVKYFKSFNKYPVMNIGTYLRTWCIDNVISCFLSNTKGTRCQIISIGAGSDTRVFELLKGNANRNLTYIEMDFPETTQMKASIVLSSDTLSNILQIDNKQASQEPKDQLHSQRYHLLPIDLRNISSLQQICDAYTEKDAPTLIISECVLCYIDADTTLKILDAFQNYFSDGVISIYEPMSLDDNFGTVMNSNLSSRGLNLPSMNVFKDLQSQYNRLSKSLSKNCNTAVSKIFANDMCNIYNTWIPAEEKLRISRLEFLDELEELFLLLKHYCFIVGCWYSNTSSSEVIQNFINSLNTYPWKENLKERRSA